MRIYGMKVNQLPEPMGFKLSPLRFSYKTLCDTAKKQKAARIRVYDAAEQVVYDSTLREDIDSLCFEPALALAPRARYSWDVQVVADNGEEGLSPRAYFETGKMEEKWLGQWIAADEKVDSPRLFKRFTLPQKVLSARLYICGLGLYEAYINQEKVGDEYLAPNCNDYDQWLQYQTYDVTDLLAENNELSVLLGDGWYKGRFGFQGQKEVFGDTLSLLCEMHITLQNGEEVIVASDDTWQSCESPVRFSNIYDGEVYDASIDDSQLHGTRLYPQVGYTRLTERLSPPVRVMHTLRPVEVIRTKKDETILDFGQVMTGFVTFRTTGEKGHTYHLQYGEVLQDDCFYNDNLRTAKAEFTWICDGSETWARPHFTFYGFRYVKIEGFGENIDPYDFVGCVLYSDMEKTGFVKTSNEKVNRLAENALWGQRGNFLDVPTDCPQRDERMGWTGDAQAFCATACYQMDSAAFYTKYMYDMAQEQKTRDGAVPHVIPSFNMQGSPSCAWADAAAIIPWTVYLFYGDKALLRAQYENMKMWVEWIYRTDEETGGKRLWHAAFHFADWLALDADFPSSCRGGTDRDFIASCFYLYSTRLTAKAAGVLGYTTDAARYTLLESEILQSIRNEYFTATGRLSVNTQTAYILSLFLGIPEEKHVPLMRKALDQKFENSHSELRTGFVGTGYLCRVLTQHGFNPLAYSLFLREEYPGWLYEVNMGATTVWERWNSILPDGRISDTGMNSLNHYAYGAVMEWLYRDAAGLSPVENAPGFRRVRMEPHPDARLPEIDFAYESAVGRYRSALRVTGDKSVEWQVTVPFDGEAELVLPLGDIKGDAQWQQKNGKMHATVPAGTYTFVCEFEQSPWRKSLLDTTFAELMADEAMQKKILAAAPDIEKLFTLKSKEKLTLRKMRDFPFSNLPASQFRKLEDLLCDLSFRA